MTHIITNMIILLLLLLIITMITNENNTHRVMFASAGHATPVPARRLPLGPSFEIGQLRLEAWNPRSDVYRDRLDFYNARNADLDESCVCLSHTLCFTKPWFQTPGFNSVGEPQSLYANLCPTIQQQKLLSGPRFDALEAYLPAWLLLSRSVFQQTPVLLQPVQKLRIWYFPGLWLKSDSKLKYTILYHIIVTIVYYITL